MELISICIPTFNGEQFLQEALDSVKVQSYKNLEVIISDDHSKDRTLEICNNFKKEVGFPVFIYQHKPEGIGSNWNNCVKKSNGQYIKFLFQDDLLDENCLQLMLDELKETNLKICISKRNIICDRSNLEIEKWIEVYGDLQKDVKLIKENVISKNIFSDSKFLQPPYNKIGEPIVGLIHKDVYKNVGLYNESLKQFLDYEFWYRALKQMDFAYISLPLVSFRFHPLQTTNVNIKNKINEKPLYFEFVKKELSGYLQSDVRKKYFPTLLERIIKKIKL